MTKTTTAGCITSYNSLKAEKYAMSWWTAINNEHMLDGSEYADRVREVAAELDFDLEEACNDTPGGENLIEDIGRVNAVGSFLPFSWFIGSILANIMVCSPIARRCLQFTGSDDN
jgi:hypothetical protein